MDNLADMIWIEAKKAIRSKLPLWTALGFSFMPLSIAFLIYLARNPDISKKLGLISAKADLVAYSATDWSTYLGLSGQIIAMGGFFVFILTISWIFGREFSDGTVKDLLAVPVQRSSILLAKFLLGAIWSVMMSILICIIGLVMGAIIKLPGGTINEILRGCTTLMITACMTIATVLPFAFLASVGRGYLLPLGLAVLTLITTNMVVIAGWGEYFPWAIPGLYAQGKNALTASSYGVVVLTSLVGMVATYLWWKYADQSR